MSQPESLDQVARRLKERGEAYALVTVVHTVAPTAAYVGARAIVDAAGTLHGWIGGGCAKGVVVSVATKVLASGLPKLVRISNEQTVADDSIEQHAMRCASNGTIELFIEPQLQGAGMCVLGATPAADEVRFLAERLGIRLGTSVDAAPIVLVATQGEGDEAALEAALASAAEHVLMIASPRKAERLRAAMLARGLPPARVAALQAPVGPDIGASTPAEIALSAVVEVVRLRRLRAGSRRGAPTPPEGYRNPVCGALITPAMVIHTLVHDGVAQYFCCDHCKVEFERDPDKYTALSRPISRSVSGDGAAKVEVSIDIPPTA